MHKIQSGMTCHLPLLSIDIASPQSLSRQDGGSPLSDDEGVTRAEVAKNVQI